MWKDLKVGVFVDAANIYASCGTAFNRKIDYEKLLAFAVGENRLFRAIIYAVKHGDMNSWESALKYMGYEVRTKEPVRYSDGNSKADWDVQICMDIVQMVDGHCIDMPVIASGDGDFIPLVRWCQSKGRPVMVIGVEGSTNRELKEVADVFIPIGPNQLRQEQVKPSKPETPKFETPKSETPKFERPYQPQSRQSMSRSFGKGLGTTEITQEERQALDKEIEAAEREGVRS